MIATEKIKKGFQGSYAYEELKRRIITLEMKPGQIIDEKKIIFELEVGRTPFREAIQHLKKDDLIVNLPNKSAYVKELTLKDVKDILEALLHIEKLTTFLAAQRISVEALDDVKKQEELLENAVAKKNYGEIVLQNKEFHTRIAKSIDNKYMISIHENLRDQSSRLSYLALSNDFDDNSRLEKHHKSIIDYHRKIISLLEKRDAEQAVRIVVEHLKLFQKRVMFYISQLST